ncbi:MAG TPA: hypothetical protein VK174_15765, partial [Chitinophagales bacterium]|nr:hypothetical protein [Chitinophagales bacterium]
FEVHNLNKMATDSTIAAQQHDSYLIADIQRNLKTNYRIPLSASLGIKLVYPAFSLALSAEYFMGSKNHIILQGADRAVVRPTNFYGGDTVVGFLKLQTSIAPVINAGFGAEVRVSPTINALFGARTDFSNQAEYLPNNAMLNVPSAKSPRWDYLYLSTGFSYKLPLHNLTVGFDYGIGFARNKKQIFNTSEPDQQNYLRGQLQDNMRTSVHRLNFILSYTYFFTKKESQHGPISFIRELQRAKKAKKKAPPVKIK